MQLKLLFFGVLTDVTGTTNVNLETEATDIEALDDYLQTKYPALKKHTYKIAVNREIVTNEKTINDGDEIAFLPPFSGG